MQNREWNPVFRLFERNNPHDFQHHSESYPCTLRGLYSIFYFLIPEALRIYKSQLVHLCLIQVKRFIARHRKIVCCQSLNLLINELSFCIAFERLTYTSKQKSNISHKIWDYILTFLELRPHNLCIFCACLFCCCFFPLNG